MGRSAHTDPAAPTREQIAAGEFVSVPIAMKRLALGRSHVYSLMERGQLAYLRSGRSRRVSVVSLEHYIMTGIVVRDVA